MRKLISYVVTITVILLSTTALFAQQSNTVSGTVKNQKSLESLTAVSVIIKGSTSGTYTDDKGNFKITTSQKPPFILVFSSVGFVTKEVTYSGSGEVSVELNQNFVIGDEVVVSASRVPEKILESPVSIERLSAAAIRDAPAAGYYDMLANLKGVDVVSSSLTFKSVGTRGFNVNGNLRLNQIVDGMDNQAPGLNFSVGSIVGVTELDVDNIELLPGASSALYGPGGQNGTVIISSKDPFKYQGLSFQIKQGVNHVDSYQRPAAPFYDWSLRWAKKVSDRFAFKIGAQFIQAQDWLANNKSDYSRTTGTPNGQPISGDRVNDPNYDGVNVYGDETTSGLTSIANSVFAGVQASIGTSAYNALYSASASYLGAVPSASLAQYNSFLNANGGAALVAGGYSSFFYGNIKGYYSGVNVSRTGYDEKDVINPTTINLKLSTQAVYKISKTTDLSFLANFGTGNTVYTGSDRYSLKNLKIGQYKLELKNRNWYLRAYTTQENAGDAFNATITTRLFNEAWKASSVWYPTYTSAYTQFLSAGLSAAAAHNSARAVADAGRPTGFIGNNPLFQKIASTPISQGGGLFVDKTSLYQVEGQYNLSEVLGLAKTKTDFLVGANWKRYLLNSDGTLFADHSPIEPGKIKIDEIGAYAQLSQKFFNDVLKLSVSGRYDKNTNFDGKFTPRASAVVKLAKNHNLRFSYQTAYRFPSTQNQWINLLVSGGIRLFGGLPQLRDYYQFNTNPVYTLASVQAFGAALAGGSVNPALLQVQNFDKFKPESSTSFEVGYKGQIAKKLLIDVYAYWATYKDFIGGVTVVQSQNGSPLGLVGYNANGTLGNSSTTRTIYSISVNTPGDVKTSGWGASVEYLLPKNFSVNANIYSDQIGDLPSGFVSYFNTPKTRLNIGLNNSGFLFKNNLGFSMVYRWQQKFFYEGTFAVGDVPAFGTLDAALTYKLPATKSLIKLGASNVFNKYYINGYGNAQIGGLYYISYAMNVF